MSKEKLEHPKDFFQVFRSRGFLPNEGFRAAYAARSGSLKGPWR
jgi:hypothetical protein